MVRGSGKFKTKRGGGRSFSRHLALDENGTAVSVDRRRSKKEGEEDDSDEDSSEEEEEEEEEEESEEEEEEDIGPSKPAQPELTRAERREMKKKKAQAKQGQGEAKGDDEENEEDEGLVNLNRVTKKMNISDLGAPRELSRREREAKEKKEAQERYWKLHLQGKTDQAKADLSRLAQIRKEREEAQAKRKAEAEAKAAELEAKKAAQRAGKRS